MAEPRRAWAVPLALLAALLAGLGLALHAEVAGALRVWQASTAYGHCVLILPIAAYLVWERRAALATLAPAPAWRAAILALPLLALWLLADRLDLMEGRQFAGLFLAWLAVLVALGPRVTRVLAVPLAYTIFLVPSGAFLVPALQRVTAALVGAGLGLLDIPHLVTAELIEIPQGRFEVAEACAGLRFLVAAVAFGALYACLLYRSPWRRVGFIALCMVVPVLANAVRALGIVLLGHWEGTEVAGSVDHILYGWLFFSLVIALLVLLGLPFRQDRLSENLTPA